MSKTIKNELDLFGELMGFTSAYLDYDSGNSDSKVKLKTLVSIESTIVIVEGAEKRRDFRFLYVGNSIKNAFIMDFGHKTFGDIKRENGTKFFWPQMSHCLESFVQAHRKNQMLLSGHELELVVGAPLVYKRLTVPVRRSRGTPLVFSAFMLSDQHSLQGQS
ncbi:MAG: hypothetical protein LCH61_06140 [Proteobacteria bacterium]|nr:hypothetical protein [Pseudomonadota bacterium]